MGGPEGQLGIENESQVMTEESDLKEAESVSKSFPMLFFF